MKRMVPLFCLLAMGLGLSGCGLTPKGSVLKNSAATHSQADQDTKTPQLSGDSTAYYFGKAEELYGAGVAANQESDWSAAQEKFEKALEILYIMHVDESDTALVNKYNCLLREIAYEYKNTLVYLGELADDTSQVIFLEQFYDLQTFKNQDFAISEDSEETEVMPESLAEAILESPAPVSQAELVEWNWKVKKELDYLTGDNRGHFQDYLYRSGKYLDLMRPIVKQKGLPEDLVYLPLIESGFNPKAYSWAHASGPWQFISSTGKKYGLTRNWWYDERRDFIKSTEAACDYLKFLYGLFGDWKLALAAYNGGEGRVGRAIKRQRTSDFWKLDLRKQTEDYVPRFMAAILVAKEPEKYGFSPSKYSALEFEIVEIKHCLDLKEVAKKLDEDIQVLREFNPELLRDVTPPGLSRYQLRIPTGKKDLFWASYSDLSSKGASIFAQHKIRRGETLSRIADKYGVTTTALAELNGITARKTLRAGQYLTVPVKAGGNSNYSQSSSIPQTSVSAGSRPYFTYTVKREDSLHKLALRYGTSISAIRRLNGFSSRRILYAGEKIKIPGSNGYASQNPIDRLTETLVIHIVRDGDTLWKIAQNYGATLTDLLNWNKLADADEIRPGQRLKVYKN